MNQQCLFYLLQIYLSHTEVNPLVWADKTQDLTHLFSSEFAGPPTFKLHFASSC